MVRGEVGKEIRMFSFVRFGRNEWFGTRKERVAAASYGHCQIEVGTQTEDCKGRQGSSTREMVQGRMRSPMLDYV